MLFEIIVVIIFLSIILYTLQYWISHHYKTEEHFEFFPDPMAGKLKFRLPYEPPVIYPSFYEEYSRFANERYYMGMSLQAELLDARGAYAEDVKERIRTYNREQETHRKAWDERFKKAGFDRRKGDAMPLGTIILLEDMEQ